MIPQMLNTAIQGSPVNAAIYETENYRCVVWQQADKTIVKDYTRNNGQWFRYSQDSWPNVERLQGAMYSVYGQHFSDPVWESVSDTEEFRTLLLVRFTDSLYYQGRLDNRVIDALGDTEGREYEGEWTPRDRPRLLLRIEYPSTKNLTWLVTVVLDGKEHPTTKAQHFDYCLTSALKKAQATLPWWQQWAIKRIPGYEGPI